MINLICIDKPKYVKKSIRPNNYILAICTVCGSLEGEYPHPSGPKETKSIYHICYYCMRHKRFPENVRMKRRFIQYLDDNKNLLQEKEYGRWPT